MLPIHSYLGDFHHGVVLMRLTSNKIHSKEPGYEYMVHVWGGFFNKEHVTKHGERGGYYWFGTSEERMSFVEKLKRDEEKYKAHTLVVDCHEGLGTRNRTVATMNLVYNGKEYYYEEDFGYAYPPSGANYMFKEGNYACDCNRSLFLRRKYGDAVEKLSCGDTITMRDLRVELRLKIGGSFEEK
jgi:hypothetical protein